jgi:hypothetical protein
VKGTRGLQGLKGHVLWSCDSHMEAASHQEGQTADTSFLHPPAAVTTSALGLSPIPSEITPVDSASSGPPGWLCVVTCSCWAICVLHVCGEHTGVPPLPPRS